LYGLPKDWSTDCIIFNKDLFDNARVDYIKESLSWEEFLSIAKKLTRRDENGRIINFAFFGRPYFSWIYENGGKIFSEDGTKCIIDRPEAVEAIKFMIDLSVKYRVNPTTSMRKIKQFSKNSMFVSGRLAMVFVGRWYYPFILEKMKGVRWGVAPNIHGKKRLTPFGANGYAISRQTKHPDEAWKFLEFLAGKEGQTLTARKGWNIPSMKEVAYSNAFLNNPNHPPGLNKMFLEEAEHAVPYPISQYIEYNRYLDIIEREIELAELGKKTVEEALKKSANQINLIMEENQSEMGK